jgi:hypothetical protein
MPEPVPDRTSAPEPGLAPGDPLDSPLRETFAYLFRPQGAALIRQAVTFYADLLREGEPSLACYLPGGRFAGDRERVIAAAGDLWHAGSVLVRLYDGAGDLSREEHELSDFAHHVGAQALALAGTLRTFARAWRSRAQRPAAGVAPADLAAAVEAADRELRAAGEALAARVLGEEERP